MKWAHLILAGMVPVLLATAVYGDVPTSVQECWQHAQDRGGEDWAAAAYDLAMAVDGDGNVYVTHPRWNETTLDSDIVTKKLDPKGNKLWETPWDGEDVGALPDDDHPGDVPHDITVGGGRVYVTGQTLRSIYRSDNDYVTICYNAGTGEELWVSFYDYAEEDDEAFAIGLSFAPCASYVYVTGESFNDKFLPDDDVATIKYSALTGNELWTPAARRYDGGGDDYASSILVGGGCEDCNVYVAGGTWRGILAGFWNYLAVSYTPGGTERWVNNDYDGPGQIEFCYEYVRDITACNGILYLTGQVCGGIGTGWDYGTIAKDCIDGNLIGDAINGGLGDDVAWGIAADDSCNLYVTGEDEDAGDYYLATVKYDWLLHEPALAANVYPNPSRGRDIVVDECGYPYATGWRIYDSASNPSNYITIKYEQHDAGDPGDFDRVWTKIQYHDGLDEAYRMAAYGCETVYVTGESEGDDDELDIVTKKYSERGACFDCWSATCLDNVAEADCQGTWEVWDQCGVCTDLDPAYPEICTVACCSSDGLCSDTTVYECHTASGIPQGLGTECTEPEACCLPGGTCAMVDPLCCDDLQGWEGYCDHCLGDLNSNGIDDACEPAWIVAVDSCYTHGAAGEFCLDIGDGGTRAYNNVEPRLQLGVAPELELECSRNVSSNGALVGVSCDPDPYGGTATVMADGSDTARVQFSGPLPDQSCCTLTFIGDIEDCWAVVMLEGDVNFDCMVSTADLSSVKARLGDEKDETNFWYDVNRDCSFSIADRSSIKARLGNLAPCPCVCP